jgi:hypothetical protein
VYWAVTVAGLALLIVDIFDDGAIAVRPGGVRGPRAAAADEPAPRTT